MDENTTRLLSVPAATWPAPAALSLTLPPYANREAGSALVPIGSAQVSAEQHHQPGS